ncbi:MAG: DNA polymerase/3'-5' exonuclease PolX [Planctomycetes bacterium]|nr:DNA polymerase/3'-5' exonuclease PolX [Planctomycetota bacterium]
MTNAQIADTLELLADLLEFQGANPFRVRSYRNGARTIRDHAESIESIVAADPRRLLDIEGVGDSVADKCVSLVQTGRLEQLEALQAEVPESVLKLLRVPGVGPKKAATLHKELGIRSLAELEQACRDGRVRSVRGFGAKTEEAILRNVVFAEKAELRILWADADRVAVDMLAHMRSSPVVRRAEMAGSYRRGRDTVGDLDLLVVAADREAAMDHLAHAPRVRETLARGETKMSVRLDSGLQLDLRAVPAESFGAALQYFTGSKAHNVELRGRAKDRGLKINEYGVFRGDEPIAGAEENEVYAAIGLPWFPPELREARREFEWADAGRLPKLIEPADIRGDLHMHTTATDGRATVEQMVEAASRLGYEYIAVTDHSRRVTMARGLDPARLRAQWKAIDRLRGRRSDGPAILKGVECDILEKGGMDLPDDVLAEADWVLASIHYGQRQSRAQITERVLEAIEHPHVNAIAHPTGRLLQRREAYEIDLDAVFQAAARHSKILELNANPARLDLDDIQCAAACRHGIPIVINTDAHGPEGLDDMRYGVTQARRAGLTRDDVLNTRPWKQVERILARGH